MRDISAVKERDKLRAEIQRKTEEFIQNGGKIEVLPGFQASDGFRFDYWYFSHLGPEFVKTELGGL